MASTARSIVSEKAINVSQDADSSPAQRILPKDVEPNACGRPEVATESHNVQVYETLDIVEDSFPRENQTDKRASTNAANEEDDLYDTTPIKRNKKNCDHVTTQLLRTNAERYVREPPTVSHGPSKIRQSDNALNVQPSRTSIASLLANGAIVQPARPSNANNAQTVNSSE